MSLHQGTRVTGRRRLRAAVLSAALSGLWMAGMTPAVQAAVLQSKSYEYDALGRVTVERDASNAVVASYTYDANGNKLTSTDALNRVTTYEYDELNRLKKVTDPAAGLTQYGYDARDNLVSVTDPRNLVTTYSYNGLNQLTAQSSPDTGSTSYVSNLAGQVTSRTSAASQATAYTYDVLGRVTQATYAGGHVVTYTYDTGSNGVGRLASVSDSDSSLAWTYDADGRVLTRTQTIGSGAGATVSVLSYAYNSSGQLTAMTLPSGKAVGYTYDNQGRPAALTYDGATVLSNIQYRPFSGITSWTWGNGQTHSRTYDMDGRLDMMSQGGTVKDLNYDAVSRITEIQDFVDVQKTKTFSYDLLDRLTGYTGQNSTRGWTYDADGNRTSQVIGSTTETYSYASTSNQLLSLTNSGNSAQNRSYQYTATGHTSTDGVNTYTYDSRERLTAMSSATASASYMINPLGQRVRKSVTQAGVTTTTTFVYDEAGHLVAESDSTGSGSDYVYLGDIPVAVKQTVVQHGTGTPVVVDPGIVLDGNWTSITYASAYNSSTHRKSPATGTRPQQGVLVDEANANNTAPNTATTVGVAGWSSMNTSPWQSTNGYFKWRKGQPGVHEGVIVDDTSATFTPTSSSWTNYTVAANAHGGNMHYVAKSTTGLPTATASWSTIISTAGDYELSVSLPNPLYGYATSQAYTIQIGGTTQTASISVGSYMGGQWASLGTYSLPAGTLTVTLDNVANGSVYADALMVGAVTAPLAHNDFVWSASLPAAGTYNVYARMGCGSYGPYAEAATYNVATAAGTVPVVVGQNVTVGNWISLGSFQFNAGMNSVSLTDLAAGQKGICADSVVFAEPDAPLDYFGYVSWTPSLPSAGVYDVQAWWPTIGAVNQVLYDVYTPQGWSRVTVNQAQNGGQWVSLGQFSLDPSSAKVRIADSGVGGQYVYADAVRFVPVLDNTTAALYYIHADHLNAPRQVSTADSVPTTVWRWESEPFGSTAADADPDQNAQAVTFNLRFPGQYYDAESQLHYNYFRDYDPSIGRYIESDPIGLDGGLNTYAYVEANPIAYSDPTGLVKHTTGQTIDCGKGCWIRIDYTFDERTGTKTRHLHWGCKGKEGECGENGQPSHGGTWDDAPESIKECARRHGFQGDSVPVMPMTPVTPGVPVRPPVIEVPPIRIPPIRVPIFIP